jgi:hypothetical protein
MKRKQPLFSRTFTKEEVLDRRFNLVEDSEMPSDRVSIKNAMEKATAEMVAELDSYNCEEGK